MSKELRTGFDIDGVLFSYKEEAERFSKSRLKFKYCPQSCLLGLACTGCPVMDMCVRCNPGGALGIDHQTISKNMRGERCFAFRPYRESFDDECRARLKEYCEFYKLDLEILDAVTYAEGTLTVYLTPGKDSLQFRGGGDFLGMPWYGKGSPHARWREEMSTKNGAW